MVKNIFYFPSSYAALIHTVVGCLGLLFPLYIGVVLHPRELLTTHCGPGHYEYWPSISTTIGDMIPERQIWRTALLMAFPFRVISSLTLFYVFWCKGTSGLLDLSRFAFKPFMLVRSSSFIAAAMIWVDLTRWLAAFAWTMVVSSEIHSVHNFSFLCYIVLSICYHVAATLLVWRNRTNSSVYPSSRDGTYSLYSKLFCLIGQVVCSSCVIIFYLRHQATCADGSYSLANIFEWSFALVNLSFDATVWFDLQYEGIWLSGSPSFYQQLWASRKDAVADRLELEDSYPMGRASEEKVRDTDTASWTDRPLFQGSDVIVHTITICCPPSDTLMWFCDTFWAYQFFGGMLHCIQHMYFQPLVAMSVTWEVVAGFANASPIFLMFPLCRKVLCGNIPFFRSFLRPWNSSVSGTPMYVLFYLFVSFSHLQQLVTNNERSKILVTGVGPFFLYLALYCRFLYPSAARGEHEEMQESRRMVYTFPLGLLFSMIMRVLHISLDPLYVDPFYGCVFGMGLGLFFNLTIYRHSMFHATSSSKESKEGDENLPSAAGSHAKKVNSYMQLFANSKGISHIFVGILFGATYIFSMMFLTCANVLPRFVAVEPMPGVVWVILSFLLGLALSPSIVPICARVGEGSRGRGLRSINPRLPTLKPSLFAGFFLLCTLVLLFGTRQSNFVYTSKKYAYHQSNVTIDDWGVQDDFSGSKTIAFVGGLGMIFCAGVLYPVIMEICWVQKRYKYLQRGSQTQRLSLTSTIQIPLSFELTSFITYAFFVLAFALCMCYPFVPGGEIFREGTRRMILVLVSVILFLVFVTLRQLRHTNMEASSMVAFAQRSMPYRMILLVLFILVLVLSVRSFRAPENRGYPAGDAEFAAAFQKYILCAHERQLDVKRAMNILSDDTLRHFDKTYQKLKAEEYSYSVRDGIKYNGCFEHPSFPGPFPDISAAEKIKVHEVAQALTDFSGAIWTIHFALDNKNTDSLWRLTEVIKESGASVVGFLESDASHIHNGNRDLAEYVSYYLGFPYVDNGPTPLDNTFGCAMISRYPIVRVRRYVLPSPLGEMACMIHATLDVMGVHVETYVGHFGNTEHDADGLLQSQFLGKIVKQNPGPSMWLGYVVSYPGNPRKYQEYSDPTKPGLLRDAAHHIYTKTSWTRLSERGGYDETPPPPKEKFEPWEINDFNVEAKIPVAAYLEKDMKVEQSFRREPEGQTPRTFYFNSTNRYSHSHPRFEFLDRYCQYCFFKTGQVKDELPEYATKLQPYAVDLFDWRRITGEQSVISLSDTELQLIQLKFVKRDP